MITHSDPSLPHQLTHSHTPSLTHSLALAFRCNKKRATTPSRIIHCGETGETAVYENYASRSGRQSLIVLFFTALLGDPR